MLNNEISDPQSPNIGGVKDMSKIALGTWAWGAGAFGGDTVFGSKTDVENLKPVFDAAMKAGLNLWDTATVYGKFFLMLFVLSLSITTVAQETIFPTKFTAPAEFNTGKVHISVLSRSEHQFTLPIKHETMIVRLAEIEVYPEHLTEYLKFANEVDRQSVEREPGVVCLFPMQSAEDSTQIRILEIYASEEAYQRHIKTEHFLKYKQGTMHMVKSLRLPTMQPLDPETMKLIFNKQR